MAEDKAVEWMVIPGTPYVKSIVRGDKKLHPINEKYYGYIELIGSFGRSYLSGRRNDFINHGKSTFSMKLYEDEAFLAGIPKILFELDDINLQKIARLIKKEEVVQLRIIYSLLGLEDKAKEIDGWGTSWGAQIALRL
ncbi:MAG: hypothetical protein Q7R73_02295 [bacterium]|nr:hypothetical protein [bacterium]